MGRVFLSYARKDVDSARAFADALGGAGHEVWWDHRLRAGSRFAWDITNALSNAEAVVVLWSRHSVESAWVQDEAAEGLNGSRLVPVTLDGTMPPLGFRQYHAIAMNDWRCGLETFEPLFAAIAAAIAGESASTAPSTRQAAAQQPAICVLPFANKSGGSEQDYLSEGITEDVVTDLSRISALSVVHNGDPSADLKQLATQLGVTHVLEGTVRKSGPRLRITVQMSETTSGRTVWAERFEREFTDVFEIQDEISHAIVGALELKLLPAEKSAIAKGRTVSADAYDLYLKARGLWASAACGDYRKGQEAARLCNEATTIDLNYANAWALTALVSAELRFWQGAPVDAVTPAERALSLDPQLPEPYCVRASHLEERGKGDEAQAAIQAALNVDRDSWEANRTAAQFLFRKGEFARAIPHLEKAAMTPDHASAAMLITCCRVTRDSGGLRRAAQLAVKLGELAVIGDPTNGSAFASAARGFAALGETDRARKWVRRALAVDPGNLAMRYSLASTVAMFLKSEGEALGILEAFTETVRSEPHLMLLNHDPSWAELRDGTAFRALVGRATKRVEALSSVS